MTTASTTHFSRDLLERYVSGQLSETESESITSHLAECEACLSLTDQLWTRQPIGEALLDNPDLDTDTASRLERKLVARIHRSNLGSAVTRLGTQGFLSVAFGLLRPFMAAKPTPHVEKGTKDD